MNRILDRPDAAAEISPKRRQVSEAAERLFLVHGYGAVSMDQVARTAGVSKATLYAYFPSKDVLFATIVGDKGADNPLGPELFPDTVDDLRQALEAIGLRMLRFMLRERTLAIYRIALAESARFPELGTAFYESGPCLMIERFSTWLGMLRDRGQVRADDLVVATNQFMALMRSGVFLRRSLSMPPEASEEEIHATVAAAAETWLKAFGT
jgi:AcrR family transcriptional regulator